MLFSQNQCLGGIFRMMKDCVPPAKVLPKLFPNMSRGMRVGRSFIFLQLLFIFLIARIPLIYLTPGFLTLLRHIHIHRQRGMLATLV